MRSSTTAIVTPNGSLKTGYSYDEFGNIEQTGSQTFLNDVTFTGSVTDKSTGLQYMNSRFYNPSTGRFLSQDTYTGNPYEPWTQHLYAYCMNNPTSMVDPTGHFFNLLAGAIGACVGALAGGIINGVSNVLQGEKFSKNMGAAMAAGAITGLAAGVTMGGSLIAQAVVAAGAYGASSMVGNAVGQVITNRGFDKFDPNQVITAGLIGGAMGGLGKVGQLANAKPQVTPNEYAGAASSPNQAARSAGGGSRSSGSGQATGYHATKPEFVESITQNGFRESTSGRVGGGGVYVNNTPQGALAEYYHYNPNGPTPYTFKVGYDTGANVMIENSGAHINGPLPIFGDTLTFESLRLPGTYNTLVRNGSIRIIN